MEELIDINRVEEDRRKNLADSPNSNEPKPPKFDLITIPHLKNLHLIKVKEDLLGNRFVIDEEAFDFKTLQDAGLIKEEVKPESSIHSSLFDPKKKRKKRA